MWSVEKVVDSYSDVGLTKILSSERNTPIYLDSKPMQPQSILILTGSTTFGHNGCFSACLLIVTSGI
jgi:hypothetical protein